MENHSVAALFLALGIVIVASRIAGTIARRLHQPRVLGELLAGVLLGPTLLNVLTQPIFHGADLQPTIKEFGELGVLVLMFLIGLEVNVRELLNVGRVAVIAGTAGALLPVALTVPLALLFGYTWGPALFAGVTLAATSVSISAQVLLELGHLRSKEGSALLAAALVDDVLAILLVSVTVVLVGAGAGAQSGDAGDVLVILLRMALYLVVAGGLAWFVLPLLMDWVSTRPRLSGAFGVESFGLIFMLLFAWSAQALGGVATITGAFLAGVGISRAHDEVKHKVVSATGTIAYAFLVPIFFVDVGLETNLSTFTLSVLPLGLALLAVGVLSKLVGCGLGARVGGFSPVESLRLGVCMMSRGEVGLIIATLGLGVGVFRADDPLFSALFLVIILTTLLTPLAVRQVFPKERAR